MTVRIDLAAYAQEVEAFSALSEDFVEKASASQLAAMARELRTGIDGGSPRWTWQTDAPIRFGPSTQYDGPGRTFAETALELSFRCEFRRETRVKRRCSVWNLDVCNTHVRLVRQDADFPFHFDYKNQAQWGPQVHFQVSEQLSNLPIPRLFASAFLPTDCADLVLAEIHPLAWVQAQFRDAYHASILRDGQEGRTRAYLQDVAAQWNADRKATRIAMLQSYTARLAELPDHRGRSPVFT